MNAEKVTHIKGRLLIKQWFSLIVSLFKWELLLKERICSQRKEFAPRGSKFFPLWAVLYSMENHFYHIKWPPLNVTIFIMHVRNLCNGCYANGTYKERYYYWFINPLLSQTYILLTCSIPVVSKYFWSERKSLWVLVRLTTKPVFSKKG